MSNDFFLQIQYHDPDVSTRLKTWNWLEFAEGIPISSLDIDVPSPLVKVAEQIDIENGLASVIIGGGVLGQEYIVTCRCSLASGESEDNSYRVIVVQK